MGASGMATVRSSVAAFLKSVPDDVRDRGRLVLRQGQSSSSHPPPTRARSSRPSTGWPPRVRRRCTTASTSRCRTLGSKGERSILLLSDGGDTASRATQAVHGGCPEEREGARGGRVVQVHRQQRQRAPGLRQGGRRQCRLRGQRGQRAERLHHRRQDPRVAAQLLDAAARRASAGPRTSRSPASPAARRSPPPRLVDFGAGVAASPSKAAADKSPVVGPTEDIVKAAAPAATLPILGVSPALGLGMGAVFVALMALVIALSSGVLQVRSPDAGREHRPLRRRRCQRPRQGQVPAERDVREPRVPRRAHDGGPRLHQQDHGAHQPRRPAPAGR